MKIKFTLLAAVLIMVINSSSQAQVVQPSPTPPPNEAPCAGRYIHTYFDASSSDPLAFNPFFFYTLFDEAGAVLKGFLYLPGESNVANSPKKLPLIVYGHGSGTTVNDPCAMANYFTDKGFAFFVPHRRGHGLSTGLYYLDFLDLICSRTAQEPFGTCGIVTNNEYLMSYLQDQSFEIAQAIYYMKTLKNSSNQPIINPDKIAIMGHSFGGMMALFSNDVLTGHKAVINIAGASQSWTFFDEEDGINTPDDSNSIRILKDAVRGANEPIYFLEPKNDVSIRPTVVFSRVAGNQEQRYQASIFGPVPNVSSTDEAHSKFVKDKDEVKRWGPSVIEFLSRFGVK